MRRQLRGWLLAGLLAVASLQTAQPAEPAIQLAEGMVIAIGGTQDGLDFENLMTLDRLTDTEATFAVRWFYQGKLASQASRTLRRSDIASAPRLNNLFQTGDPERFPGSTLAMLSSARLAELKTSGGTALVVGTKRGGTAFSGLVPSGRKYYRGRIERVGTEAITVLVNGQPRALVSLHTRGDLSVAGDTITLESWWHDNPDLPLMLRDVESGQTDRRSQIVRIDFPGAAARVQQQLESPACRAELPGVYFDTGSAFLLPQSTATLGVVAGLLRANPGWQLTVEGHTDPIGGVDYNLDLSRRRAGAVRDALLALPGLQGAKLQVQGFGATRPVARNDTLEGRARNRRVELTRDCPR
jgi:outer membrane protein OmpA-like peptidoglycan-associated protein